MRTKGLTIWVGNLAAAAIVAACGGSTIEVSGEDASSRVPDASAEAQADSGDCFIVATNYDQSCSADSDCVTMVEGTLVEFGDYCTSHCLCGGGAINKSAAAKYAVDVAKTPLGSGAISGAGACPCWLSPSSGRRRLLSGGNQLLRLRNPFVPRDTDLYRGGHVAGQLSRAPVRDGFGKLRLLALATNVESFLFDACRGAAEGSGSPAGNGRCRAR
jgi:hypothetical protein